MAWTFGRQLLLLHEACHAFTRTGKPLRMQFSVNTWAPIDATIVVENLFDFLGNIGIFSAVVTGFTVTPGVKTTDRDFQCIAHHGDWILLVMLSNELKFQSWVREKMLMAFPLNTGCARHKKSPSAGILV
jgi:hypothetical protein